jgi:hypothetical protein
MEVQGDLESLIERKNADLEDTLKYASSHLKDDMVMDGYKVTVNEEDLPSRMVDLKTGQEIDYEYLNLDPSGKETKAESQEDINMIRITSREITSMTLCGTRAREAVKEMRRYVSNKRNSGAGSKRERRSKDAEAPSPPKLLQYGMSVAKVAALLEDDLKYELDKLREEESKDLEAQAQDKTAASSGDQPSADSKEALTKIYNKIYTKVEKVIKEEGFHSDYIITEGCLSVILKPDIEK